MGCGKSTTAKKLAKLTRLDVIDTDALIEEREKMSIKDIFVLKGEEYFRHLECKLRDELASKSGFIISCGGGFANLEDLKKLGFVIFLDLNFYQIANRLKNDTKRPKFDNNAKALYDKRLPIYNAICDIKINPMAIKAKELVKILEIFLDTDFTKDVRKAFIKPFIKNQNKIRKNKNF